MTNFVTFTFNHISNTNRFIKRKMKFASTFPEFNWRSFTLNRLKTPRYLSERFDVRAITASSTGVPRPVNYPKRTDFFLLFLFVLLHTWFWFAIQNLSVKFARSTIELDSSNGFLTNIRDARTSPFITRVSGKYVTSFSNSDSDSLRISLRNESSQSGLSEYGNNLNVFGGESLSQVALNFANFSNASLSSATDNPFSFSVCKFLTLSVPLIDKLSGIKIIMIIVMRKSRKMKFLASASGYFRENSFESPRNLINFNSNRFCRLHYK